MTTKQSEVGVQVHVKHDPDGAILSMGHFESVLPGIVPLGPVGDERVIELELDDETSAMPLHEIHTRFRVDVSSGQLVPIT